jgi:hypothetical protein
MLTAGLSLLKSLGQSAVKRKREGGEEGPGMAAIPGTGPGGSGDGDGDGEDSASKRARGDEGGGGTPPPSAAAAAPGFITSVRKTKSKWSPVPDG